MWCALQLMLRLPWPVHYLRVMPNAIGSPWLVTKLVQDQSTKSEAAQALLGYR
jgi:hypothetical protein